ncbi:hypothetical protein GCM10011529_02050 [Polymorphobacter glacialis]|uniref:HdeD family acid-resistance protein n=1 Tax=Sandarakinorhabdus glacialis TaxID=1614636 RepID=A0A916ZJH0_9SPHN|nr:hypothetical protein GCM10011529_02050 [Polymorphobacter glacialis]
MVDDLSPALARDWGYVAIRGILGVCIGIFALVNPIATLGALLLLFVVYAIADGLAGVISAIRAAGKGKPWGWLLIQAVVSLVAAGVILGMPQFAVRVFLYVMAFWAILGGISLIIAALKLQLDHGRWWLAAAGALSIVWGALLLTQPLLGALVLTIWFGIYTLVFGIFFLILSFVLRSRYKAVKA